MSLLFICRSCRRVAPSPCRARTRFVSLSFSAAATASASPKPTGKLPVPLSPSLSKRLSVVVSSHVRHAVSLSDEAVDARKDQNWPARAHMKTERTLTKARPSAAAAAAIAAERKLKATAAAAARILSQNPRGKNRSDDRLHTQTTLNHVPYLSKLQQSS